MSDPIAWGVAVMLVMMTLADVLHAGLPWWRAWLEAREKKRIGYRAE